jgi:hypothetical protein
VAAKAAAQYKLDAMAQALLEAARAESRPGVDDLERAVGRHEEV